MEEQWVGDESFGVRPRRRWSGGLGKSDPGGYWRGHGLGYSQKLREWSSETTYSSKGRDNFER